MNRKPLKKKLELFRKIILILNVFLLSFNLGLYDIRKFINLNTNIFKFSDFFIMNLNIKTYKEIAKYLTDKYNINHETSKSQISKKEIRIKTIGLFNRSNYIKWLKSKLDDEFILKFDEDNPDYLIYNIFTKEDLNHKYKNLIKIAIYTENAIPDLNLADYTIGHYHIIYLDRYFKYSIFFWTNFTNFFERRKEVLKNSKRKKFCAAVISNCNAEFRLNFIEKLNKYKKVDIGGKCQNNINEDITNKIEFLSKYKFSLAMENSDGDGYLSEKIVHSFLAGTIPIYYGDYFLEEFINPKSYILIKGEKDIEKKIEYIKKIDNDDNLYQTILKENPIIDINFTNRIDEIEIKSFLKHIFKQEKNKAYRRDDNYFSLKENGTFLSFNLIILILFLLL